MPARMSGCAPHSTQAKRLQRLPPRRALRQLADDGGGAACECAESGRATAAQVEAAAAIGSKAEQLQQGCDAGFYLGEDSLIQGRKDEAKQRFPQGWRSPKPYMRFVRAPK